MVNQLSHEQAMFLESQAVNPIVFMMQAVQRKILVSKLGPDLDWNSRDSSYAVSTSVNQGIRS